MSHPQQLSLARADFARADFARANQSPISAAQPDRKSDHISYTVSRAEIVDALNHTLQHSVQAPSPHSDSKDYADHPDLASALADSAYLCDRQGRQAEAERLYQQVIELRNRRFGGKHLSVADGLSELASFYRGQKRYSEAQPLLQQALAIQNQLLVASHVQIGDTLYQLADTFHHQQLYGKAEPLYQQALTIFRPQLGAQHPRTQAVYSGLMQMLAAAIEAGKFEDLIAGLPPLDLDSLSEQYSWAKPSWERFDCKQNP